jgi:lipid A 3-O-deacylase
LLSLKTSQNAEGRALNGVAKFALVVFLLMAGGTLAIAQSDVARSINSAGPGKFGRFDPPETPVDAAINARSWEYGPFVNWGTGVGDRSDYKFLSAGFQVGKPLTRVLHAGIFSGQFELGANIMPLWQAYTPAPHEEQYTCVDPNGQPVSCLLPTGGGTFYGVSLTPVIFRWNFATHSKRFQPWFQGAGGLIYTTHKFPPNILSTPTIDGGTSVWNFSPQGGLGLHYFTRGNRSIDLGVNAVHISSASLGDRNPGVNASIQIQVGYTFWK